MTSSGRYHARKSNAADGQKDPQIRKRICETPHYSPLTMRGSPCGISGADFTVLEPTELPQRWQL